MRTKLAVVLLIPVVLALVFAGLRVSTHLGTARALDQLGAQVTLDSKVNNVVQQLQRERALSVWFVATGRTMSTDTLVPQRRKVDHAIARFERSLGTLRGDLSAASADRFDVAAGALDGLAGVRQAVRSTHNPPAATQQAFTYMVQALLNVSDQETASINVPELARLHLAINALASVKEQDSLRRAMFLQVFQIGKFGPEQLRLVLSSQSRRAAALAEFKKFASPEQQRRFGNTVSGELVDTADNLEETGIGHELLNQPLPHVRAKRWNTAATTTVDLTNQVQTSMQATMADRTDAKVADARRSAIINGALVLALLLVALVLAVIVARSLLRPLRTLRRGALAVADYQLPEEVDEILADSEPEGAASRTVQPVPVHTREEVGQVARAFDAVHGEAVRLAAEQAMLRDNVNAMFVNLSRRSQTFVERQLSLIDRLEPDEQDPDQLASLFELDHLATRMRRDSENLLVLSGTELGRMMTKPVAVTEVLGAAISEVEQYARVELGPSPELSVTGRSVSDIVHLLAELLDNATVYSDPQSPVGMRSARTRAGALAIEIADHGMGLPDDDLNNANERLADPPELDVGVSRRMGLYVVARLAKRHDIKVSLRENEDTNGGTIARVVVPSTLVTANTERHSRTLAAAGTQAASAPTVTTVRRAPVTPQPQEGGTAGPAVSDGERAEPEGTDMDAPTERLPIYEAVLSQWFNEEPSCAAAPEPSPATESSAPDRNRTPGTEDDSRDGAASEGASGLPTRVPGKAAAARKSVLRGEREPTAPEPTHERQSPRGASWALTPADEGWQAALALDRPVDDVTSAGLPKRTPRAHLVPGSASQRHTSEAGHDTPEPRAGQPSQPVTPPRSAAAVRGRMSSLQQGVRRGRHRLTESNGQSQRANGMYPDEQDQEPQ